MFIEMCFLLLVVLMWSLVLRRTEKPDSPIQDGSQKSLGYFKFLQYFSSASLLFGFINKFIVTVVTPFHDSLRLMHVGIAMSAVGVALFFKAKSDLGKHFSPCYLQNVPKAIVTSGVYSLIRHPIYASNMLILAGFSLATGSQLVCLSAILLAGAYFHSAVLEEQALLKAHADYAGYLRTSGRFVPRFGKIRDLI